MRKNKFIIFLAECAIYFVLVLLLVVSTNYFVDASSTIRPMYTEMAKLALAGNTVAVPENYNERTYQVCVVNQMKRIPDTVVIGSSRGMLIGEDVTGLQNLYNHCVSGACLEDNYALLGLYYKKFRALPAHIIIEISPWVLYEQNPETRWTETEEYKTAAENFYDIVNGKAMENDPMGTSASENPYLSIPYFQYNVEQLLRHGVKIINKRDEARVCFDENEAADYPDGSFRYIARLDKENSQRLENVKKASGPCTYENVDLMTEIGMEKSKGFEALLDYLLNQGCSVELYLQPFSVTQCEHSFDDGLNEGFILAEEYLSDIADEKDIPLVGSYDARNFDLTDNRFIDSVHLDRVGTKMVWDYAHIV